MGCWHWARFSFGRGVVEEAAAQMRYLLECLPEWWTVDREVSERKHIISMMQECAIPVGVGEEG